MRRKMMIGFLGLLISGPIPAWSNTPQLSITLAQAEAQALQSSQRLQNKTLELEISQNQINQRFALLWPRLSLEATWNYATEIPSLHLAFPAFPPVEIQMSDHTNYFFGPRISWRFWDSGGSYLTWRAAQTAQRAQEEELQVLKREVILNTRLAYFQTQLALRQVVLLSYSLHLVQEQYQDIQAQAQLGASSKMDQLSSHFEVLSRQQQLQQASTDLTLTLRDLLRLLGGTAQQGDFSRLWDAEQSSNVPPEFGTPSLWLAMDSLEEIQKRLEPAASKGLDPQHPQVRWLLALVEAAEQTAQSLSTQHWPSVSAFAQTGWEYPNGPVLETIQQSRIGLSASWSLWENYRVVNQVEEQNKRKQIYQQQTSETVIELELAWQKAQDRLSQLKATQTINAQLEQETETLAKLVYSAYQVGRASYLEVQAANLRALEARTRLAITQVQILIQLAMLDSL